MKRLLALSIVLSLLLLVSCRTGDSDTDVSPVESVTYLLLGLDDAAENTDVIALLTYHIAQNRLSLLQIPRDTYYRFSTGQNKINQLYATNCTKMSKGEAAAATAREISELFGVQLVGYVALTTGGFRTVVDTLGGIDISVPEDMTVYDEYGENPMFLARGTHHLDGRQSERFVRFRRGYAMGDLGRLDAQKIFFSALLRRARSIRFDEAVTLLARLRKDALVRGEGLKITKESFSLLSQLDNCSVSYVTLPGESITAASGLSYYVLNRRATMDVLSRYVGADRMRFDREERLYKPDDLAFKNIYFDKNFGYREYTDDTLGSLHIPGAG